VEQNDFSTINNHYHLCLDERFRRSFMLKSGLVVVANQQQRQKAALHGTNDSATLGWFDDDFVLSFFSARKYGFVAV
jgi:hypothetical protein